MDVKWSDRGEVLGGTRRRHVSVVMMKFATQYMYAWLEGLTTAKIGTESKLFVLKPRKSAWPRNGNSLGTTAALDGIGCTDDLRLIL